MTTEAIQFRRDFWTRYAELYPEDGIAPGLGEGLRVDSGRVERT